MRPAKPAMRSHECKLTYRFGLKNKHDSELRRQARIVNYVWNFCGETQKAALRWPSKYELQRPAAGAPKELDVHAHTRRIG